ncbi:universal stress protein [Achromobacter veterisilvae]|uniref:Universal stress protein n=1 Tax=Achromobacter veterisilvae TaxID=2069367 RepID=A0ABZ2RWP4_9BURK
MAISLSDERRAPARLRSHIAPPRAAHVDLCQAQNGDENPAAFRHPKKTGAKLTGVNSGAGRGAMMETCPVRVPCKPGRPILGGAVKNVLVPVDGSANSLRAVRYMVDHIRENGPCAIHLLNVQLPIVSGTVLAFVDQTTIQEYYEDEAKTALSDAKAVLDKSGIVYQAALRVGNIAESIKAYATEQQCDHVVMGSRGLGATGSLLLGSVTLKVLHTIHIPVILIN